MSSGDIKENINFVPISAGNKANVKGWLFSSFWGGGLFGSVSYPMNMTVQLLCVFICLSLSGGVGGNIITGGGTYDNTSVPS